MTSIEEQIDQYAPTVAADKRAAVADLMRSGWLETWGEGLLSIALWCVWCGCQVHRKFKEVHRVRCTKPAELGA